MDLDDIFDKEVEALEKQLENNEISQDQFLRYVYELKQDIMEQQYIQDMKDAGRSYLL